MLENEFKEISMIRWFPESTVYLCLHKKTGVHVNIEKIPHDHVLTIEEEHKLSDEIGRRKVLSNLSTFQRTLDIIRKKEYTWIISENVGGNNLYDMIANGPLPMEQARYLFFLLTYTVLELQGRNYAILDWDPENFYFFTTMFKFTNYRGILTTGTYENKDSLMWIGDPRWMSPESLGVGEYDIVTSNIFCLGLYLYAFLTGKLFPTMHNKGDMRVNYSKPDLSSIEGTIDKNAFALLKTLLRKPDERPSLRAILNHQFLKPHVPFPHYHPPLVLEDNVKEWITFLKHDPNICLAELKDLNVSENTLIINLSITAAAKGYKPQSMSIKNKINIHKYVKSDFILLPEKLNIDLEMPPPPEKPKKEKKKDDTKELDKLMDFCRKRLEERGVRVQTIIQTPRPKTTLI